jgi:hypothetical protein
MQKGECEGDVWVTPVRGDGTWFSSEERYGRGSRDAEINRMIRARVKAGTYG